MIGTVGREDLKPTAYWIAFTIVLSVSPGAMLHSKTNLLN